MSRAEKIEAARVKLREAVHHMRVYAQTSASAQEAIWQRADALEAALALPADPPSERPAAVEPAPVPVGLREWILPMFEAVAKAARENLKNEQGPRNAQIDEVLVGVMMLAKAGPPPVADAGQDAEREAREWNGAVIRGLMDSQERLALEVKAERARADAAEAKLAEMERERDEARAFARDYNEALIRERDQLAADLAVERGRVAALVEAAEAVCPLGRNHEMDCAVPERGGEPGNVCDCGKAEEDALRALVSDLDAARLAHDERVRAEARDSLREEWDTEMTRICDEAEGLRECKGGDANPPWAAPLFIRIGRARAEGHAAGVAVATERAARVCDEAAARWAASRVAELAAEDGDDMRAHRMFASSEQSKALAARIRASAAKEE